MIVHTGQHYDEALSRIFFEQLGLPRPDVDLGVGSGSHAQQTARIMAAIEPVLADYRPDLLMVVGDVNSTVAAALVAAKLGIHVAHVEAGLRSFDWSMPEEINRVVTDRLSTLLFTTERSGNENLAREGVAAERVHFVGNVMIDTLMKHRERALATGAPAALGVERGEYVLVTLHRPSNVDEVESLALILDALAELSRERAVLFPVHPRTRARIADFGLGDRMGAVRLLDPVGYLEFLALMEGAALLLTDSGGVQEETTALGVPCLTLRPNTERPVTIEVGTNRLVELESGAILDAARSALAWPPGSSRSFGSPRRSRRRRAGPRRWGLLVYVAVPARQVYVDQQHGIGLGRWRQQGPRRARGHRMHARPGLPVRPPARSRSRRSHRAADGSVARSRRVADPSALSHGPARDAELRDRVADRRGANIGAVAAARQQMEYVFYALRDGPAALPTSEKVSLLQHAPSLIRLHRELWSRTEEQLAPWWRLAIRQYPVIPPPPMSSLRR